MAISLVGSSIAESDSINSPYTLTLPGGLQENDLVIIVSGWASTSDGTPGVSGYTQITELYSNDTRDANMSVDYKFMGATPDTTASVTAVTAAGSHGSSSIAFVLRGVDTTNPFDVTSTTATGTNTATPDNPSITPTTSGAWVLATALCTQPNGTSDASVALSGYSNVVTSLSVNGSNRDALAMIASKEWTSGAENPSAWTGITSSAFDSWCAATLAVRPASGGGGGSTGQIKAKVSSAFGAYPVKAKLSGTFATKPVKYKSGGTFTTTGY